MTRLAAWLAALLTASLAAILVPAMVEDAFLATILFPWILAFAFIVGLPLVLLARFVGWTEWWRFAAAGLVLGGLSALWIVAGSGASQWPRAVVALSFGPIAGTISLRGMLELYRLLDDPRLSPAPSAPSPWPVTILLLIVTGYELNAWYSIVGGI